MLFAAYLKVCGVLLFPSASALLHVQHSETHHGIGTSASERQDLDEFILGINDTKGNDTLDKWLTKLNRYLKDNHCKITEGNTNQNATSKERGYYDMWAETRGFKTVCETGFNAGHSALRFLALSNAHVYEFDLGFHKYGKHAASFLYESFPGRLTITWGDSTESLTRFHKANPNVKCDLVIVDGGHDYEVAISDLKNFMPMVSKNHVLAMDDTPCDAKWCQGPNKAWQEMLQKGCIHPKRFIKMGQTRGFSVGKYMPCSF